MRLRGVNKRAMAFIIAARELNGRNRRGGGGGNGIGSMVARRVMKRLLPLWRHYRGDSSAL